MRFAWLLLVASCGGKLIAETDAGDAAIPKDASEAASDAGGSGIVFECGETGHIVLCDSAAQYCLLVKTSTSRAYSCEVLPADCTTPASSKYDCGCFQSGAEIFLTNCK